MRRGKPVLMAWDYYERRPRDNGEPRAFASAAGLPLEQSPLRMEGGNLLSNGRGLCVTSDAAVDFNFGRQRWARAAQLLRAALKRYGCHETVILESLEDEATGWVPFAILYTSPGHGLWGCA